MLLPIVLFLILFLIDLYVYKGISVLIENHNNIFKKVIKLFYWLVSLIIIFQFLFIITHLQDFRATYPENFRFWNSIFFVLIISKISFLIFHFIDDIFHLSKVLFSKLSGKKTPSTDNKISRGSFLTKIGLGTSMFLFGAFTFGIFKTRYSFKIFKERLKSTNLPKSFNGLKIVQISDLHLGSFVNDFDDIRVAIKMINDLKPDLILFTGDMVNVHSDEAEPWIDIFSELNARIGKFSVFGNHDYCDYGNFTEDQKSKSINRLKKIHSEMGFKLLEDEHTFIETNNEKIALIGMHNWGKDFHQVGDLDKAIRGLDDKYYKILLSHDPSLWEERIENQLKIDLTLSGHTHGMQMGVEVPSLNIKWSPVSLRYKRWAGLYNDGTSYLYINRGLGFIGYPGRVGILPEITYLELIST